MINSSLMIDIAGTALTPQDIDVIRHPLVGGVILFTRNYVDKAQLGELCQALRKQAEKPLLIAVDHEGGRIQRFRPSFTQIPPMRSYGDLYDREPQKALELLYKTGQLIASELAEVGIDFSFTPVVDIDTGTSEVIGNRAFHTEPQAIGALASQLIGGLKSLGMASVAKHFPGHGAVEIDSHLDLPIDRRDEAAIRQMDIIPFQVLIDAGITAVMPAHIVYSAIDSAAAGFSRYWLQNVLRGELQFDGAIFSDDLSMQAAHSGGDIVARARAAMAAGCDMLLVCNNRPAVEQLLSDYRDQHSCPLRQKRLSAMAYTEPDGKASDFDRLQVQDQIEQLPN